MDRAAAALQAAGITVEDFLANAPAARDDVVNEAYGEEFMQDLERRYGSKRDGDPAP
jgi:hypothetical protein